MVLDGSGSLYIADQFNNAVRLLRTSDLKVSTFVPAFNAPTPLDRPVALALDQSTNLYVVNQGSGTVLKFDRYGNSVAQIVSGLNFPTAIGIDTNIAAIYVSELNGVVSRFDFAGHLTKRFSVMPQSAQLRGLVVMEDGRVIVSDAAQNVLWSVGIGGGAPAVVAGVLGASGAGDGPLGFARFNGPYQLARCRNSSIVVADRFNHRVRVVTCGGVVQTLFGVDPAKWETDLGNPGVYPGWLDGSTEFAEVRAPYGVAVAADGRVYDSEVYYHLVREVTGLPTPAACAGGTDTGNTGLPVLTPSVGYYPAGVTVTVTNFNSALGFGPNVRLFYTTDGSDPGTNSLSVPLANGVGTLVFTGPVDLSTLRVRAFVGDSASPVVGGETPVVPTPVLSPASGYYPNGLNISVTSSNSPAGFGAGVRLFYTLDASEPTVDSSPVPLQNGVGTIPWRQSEVDLRALRVKAFVGSVGGVSVPGQAFSGAAGEIGIPPGPNNGSFSAGVGSTVMLPVVVNLRSGASLRSLQFVAEFKPGPGAPALTGLYQPIVVPPSTNDFIPLRAASSDLPSTLFGSVGSVSRLAVAYVATNQTFAVQDFAAVAMLAVPIPPTARAGQTYTVNFSTVSATSDGVQTKVSLLPMSERTLTVSNLPWLVGDSSPAAWYGAGEFGDGVLDNSDVNNAFYASIGYRVPFQFTDAFDAMDVAPEDSVGFAGGDGAIRFLDWQILLRRSLGFNLNIWSRVRDASGRPQPTLARPQGAPLSGAESLSQSVSARAAAWNPQAGISAVGAEGIVQSAPVGVPVYVTANAGTAISGMQFVAIVESPPGGAAVREVRFVPAVGRPAPSISGNSVPGIGLVPNAVYCAWNLGEFDPPLAGRGNLLGQVLFSVPNLAVTGQHYTVRFKKVDGASAENPDNSFAQYSFETVPASVWVNSPALLPREIISDEWKTFFFGDPSDPRAQAAADPDGDGFSNAAEYLSGLDPSQPDYSAKILRGRFLWRWFAAGGARYLVQRTSDLANWETLGAPIDGDDTLKTFSEPFSSDKTYFYRVKIAP